MTAIPRNMPTDAELDAFAEKWVALAPPLTEQQKSNLRRLMRPSAARQTLGTRRAS